MTLRDALTIIAHQRQFSDLDSALALIGVCLDDHTTSLTAPREPAVGPADLTVDDGGFSSNITPDGWWSEPGPIGQSSTSDDLTGDDAADGENDDRLPRPRPGQRPTGGHPHGAETRRPGVIASVLRSRPGDPSEIGQRPPLQYRSVPRGHVVPSTESSQLRSVFADRTLASTLHSMARIWQEGDEPDTDAIVESIARLEPLGRLPTIPRRGEPTRIAILSELGLRSGPYRDDAGQLLHTLRRLFSDQRLEFLTFRGSPTWGCGAGPVWTWAPYAAHLKFDATLVISGGVATRESDPELVHAFAMDELSADREVGTVLIGAPRSTPSVRPYPQLLVQD